MSSLYLLVLPCLYFSWSVLLSLAYWLERIRPRGAPPLRRAESLQGSSPFRHEEVTCTLSLWREENTCLTWTQRWNFLMHSKPRGTAVIMEAINPSSCWHWWRRTLWCSWNSDRRLDDIVRDDNQDQFSIESNSRPRKQTLWLGVRQLFSRFMTKPRDCRWAISQDLWTPVQIFEGSYSLTSDSTASRHLVKMLGTRDEPNGRTWNLYAVPSYLKRRNCLCFGSIAMWK